jgi:aspartate 1-decarboxylase
MNGAAARLVVKGDLVIIISYCTVSDAEARNIVPKLVYVNSQNAIVKKSKEICSAFSGN